MKNIFFVIIVGLLVACNGNKRTSEETSAGEADFETMANPLNLNYRYMPKPPSRREAADPTVIIFNNRYYLFASKSGGYWQSPDLIDWEFIETNDIPTEDYAPTAIVIEDAVYFMASNSENCPIYKSKVPESGEWQVVRDDFPLAVTDPAFFLDDDNRLYFYWGCSNKDPIYGVELDLENNFEPIGEPRAFFTAATDKHGWERPGDYNELSQRAPWLEGAWMSKFNGKYYLQYSAPGTEYKSYADGVYVSDNPLGPFTYAQHNPFSIKPEGFINGAGHGSTFSDKYGNLWHIATMTISVNHKFERRIGLFPAFLDDDGLLYTYTGSGDYPFKIPHRKIDSYDEVVTDWQLLSFNKEVKTLSSLEGHSGANAVDENIRTYWCAKTGNPGEWLEIDLKGVYKVAALQINFFDHNTEIYDREQACCNQYRVKYSIDGKEMKELLNYTNNDKDYPHNYIQLEAPVKARYIRFTNYHTPGGKLAISGFRVFGKGTGTSPDKVNGLKVERDTKDAAVAHLSWNNSEKANGYQIKYGVAPEKLYYDYLIYGDTTFTLRSLNVGQEYYFTIEAFNENGRSHATNKIVPIE